MDRDASRGRCETLRVEDAHTLCLLPPLPLVTFDPTSYSDVNGRARLAARAITVSRRAKTSRKMLEFMPAFAHLPPRALFLSSLSMDPLAIPPVSSRPASSHPSLFFHFLFGGRFYAKLNPTPNPSATTSNRTAPREFGNYLPPPVYCSTPLSHHLTLLSASFSFRTPPPDHPLGLVPKAIYYYPLSSHRVPPRASLSS